MPGYGQGTASITGAGRSSTARSRAISSSQPVRVGEVEPDAEAEAQGKVAGLSVDRQEPVLARLDARERDELLAEPRPLVGEERRAEHEQRESARCNGALELGRHGGRRVELARGDRAAGFKPESGLEVALDPRAVGVGVDDEEVILRLR